MVPFRPTPGGGFRLFSFIPLVSVSFSLMPPLLPGILESAPLDLRRPNGDYRVTDMQRVAAHVRCASAPVPAPDRPCALHS